MELNSVLYRQLVKNYGTDFVWEDLPPEVQGLVKQVNLSYENNKLEKQRTERVFKIVDEEFKELLERLKGELEEKNKGFDKLRTLIQRLDSHSDDEEDMDFHGLIDSIEVSIDRKLQLQKNLEQSLELIEQQSKQQSEFLSFMSHEVRTPLHVISGLVQMLSGQEILPEQESHLVKLKEIAFRSINLVNTVLEMQKIDAGAGELSLEPVNLYDFMLEIVGEYEDYLLKNNNSLSLDFLGDKNTKYQLDKFKIKQVCSNLISNAMKFTENGEVKLVVDTNSEGNEERIHINVVDNGAGLDKDQMENLFQMFSSSSPDMSGTQKGSGLGLYFCNKLLESLESRLEVKSSKGKGSSFYFDFLTKSADTVEAPAPRVSRNMLRNKKILIADDYELNIKIINGLLTKEGAETVCVSNGQEVINQMEVEDFDLVILDVNMPVLDGISTAKIIKEKYEVPVLPVTAYISEEKRKELRDLGIEEPLFKPFKFNDFIYKLENLVTKKNNIA